MKRSTFIRQTAQVIGAGMLPGISLAGETPKPGKIRFAFLSDIHVKPGAVPEEGMAKALHHVQSLRPGVDFIVNGGDSIMDSLEADKASTQTQWDLYNSILKKENSLSVYHCIGNHDVWGWMLKQNRPETDPLYGKQWAVETLAMPKRYYSFGRRNWHFIVLDSTQLNPAGGYIAYIDAEQLDWLKGELAAHTDKHICIISHIPILSICAGLFFDKNEENGDLKILRNLMHSDFFVLKKLFLQYPNIRLCLSGHIHLQDEVDYLGIKYYCNGAISGNWWKGKFREFDPAYAVVELFDDGRSSRQIINYGA